MFSTGLSLESIHISLAPGYDCTFVGENVLTKDMDCVVDEGRSAMGHPDNASKLAPHGCQVIECVYMYAKQDCTEIDFAWQG